jgi:sugar lactone lactonase YvrE
MTQLSPAGVLPAAPACVHGEGPVWDARRERLYWVNITAGEIRWLDLPSNRTSHLTLAGPVGFVSLTADRNVLIAGCGAELLRVDLAAEGTRAFARLDGPAGLRCNDGKCDPTGRLWAGTMPTAADGRPLGALYSIEANGNIRLRRDHVGCSNGLAWSLERREFYFIDSLARRIDRHAWDPASGDLGPAQTLVAFPAADGLPDGMCRDREGHLWVAFWDGGCVRRFDPATGAETGRIDLPVTRVTSCTFGGADFATLFITTASIGLAPAAQSTSPLAGRIFLAQPGPRGLPADLFPHPPVLVP